MKKNKNIRFLVCVAMLGALAGVLLFLKFPLPIAPSFYKLEFSDVPALIGGFAFNPLAAILICLIKNIINIITEGTTTAFIGELSNFIMAVSFCLPASIVYKKEHTKKGAIKSLLVGIICLCVVSCIVNYYLMIPAYVKFMNIPLEVIVNMGASIFPNISSLFTLILFCTLPFNFIKGVFVSLITYVVYKRISPLLKGK